MPPSMHEVQAAGPVAKLQVTDSKESSIELRALASARSAADAFDLRCDIREAADRVPAAGASDRAAACARGALACRYPRGVRTAGRAPGMREDTQRDRERRARTAAP